MTIYAVTKKLLLDIPTDRVLEFEERLHDFIDIKYPEIYRSIREEKKISDQTDALIQKAISEFKEQF